MNSFWKSLCDAKTLLRTSASPDKGAYTLSPGDTLGQYKFVRPLGRGGMGEVYRCKHAILKTRYAGKFLV